MAAILTDSAPAAAVQAMGIRMAFSGSGFKVPAHLGALAAVREAGYEVIEYAGTSGGAILAGLAACGLSLEAMYDLAMHQDWSELLSFNPLTLLDGMALCDGDALHDWLLEHTGGQTFGSIDPLLTVVASDLGTEAPYVFGKDATPDVPIATALRASSAIPFVYAPVFLDGRWLCDGGVSNNIPIDRLVSGDEPRLGIHLTASPEPLIPGIKTMLDIAPRVIGMLLDAQEAAHIESALLSGAKICHVETGYANGLDRHMDLETRQRLFDAGYAATKAQLAS